ncbi:MAG TPA: heparinase II/III family protein [Stellaceae bacterium]|nr:heparinase II/III family protein [Stellaceae bacterium]
MPFDLAPRPAQQEARGPHLTALESAAEGFAAPHPYLLFDAAAVPRIRDRARANPLLRTQFEKALRDSRLPSEGEEARAALKRRARRLITLSFMALLEDSDAAVAAARRALRGFTEAATWSPRPIVKNFLDSAEAAVAVSLAYDWLYGILSVADRRSAEAAIWRHVLDPAIAAYRDPSLLWPRRRDNCTLVSHAGIAIAALAVLPRFRDPAVELLRQSLASIWRIFAAFDPDGGWPEGPSYWSLAVRYAGLVIAALESSLGDSFGLADRPGFAQTGDFPLYASGPFGAAFDFADSARQVDPSPLAWLAHRFGRASDGWLVEGYAGSHLPLTTIWAEHPSCDPHGLGLPTGKVFKSSSLASFRNTWSRAEDARPVFLAIKGGNAAPGKGPSSAPEDLLMHLQADAGSFVVDGKNSRWVIDLGADDYDLPGYFDHGSERNPGQRWRYYRAQTAGHNTLLIDNENQRANAPAPIIGSCVEGDCKWVVIDLSAAYGRPPGSIRRGAALIARDVVIADEIDPRVGGDVVWRMHTSAEPVSIGRSVARFRLGEDRLTARILEPRGARFRLSSPPPARSFAVADVEGLHGRRPARDHRIEIAELPRRDDSRGRRAGGRLVRRLDIIWPRGARRLTVSLSPDSNGDGPLLPVAPLDDWLARRPIRLASCPPPRIRQPSRQSRRAERGEGERLACSVQTHASAITRIDKDRSGRKH